MEYYAIGNPIGCLLYLVQSYNLENESIKKESIKEWFKHQSPQIVSGKQEEIYLKYKDVLNLNAEIIDGVFQDLGWLTHYIKPILLEAKEKLIKSGLISPNSNNDNYTLSDLGTFLFKKDKYRDYMKSIRAKANFWQENNVIITDNDGIGSGSFINDNTIITCRHVVEDLKGKIKIKNTEDKEYTIKQIIKHPNTDIDLAKIIINEKFDFFTYELEEEIFLLDNVIVFGYPPIPLTTKAYLIANLGEISAIVDNYTDKTDCMILSCITRPGNSGGPVINEYGKLVGVMIQNRQNKLDPPTEDMSNLDINKGIAYATAILSKYIKEF